MLEALDRIIAVSSGYFRASEVGQMSFFGEATGVSDNLDIPQTISNVPHRRLLSWEKELLGIYVSDHPLTPHLEELTKVITHFSAELEETDQGQIIRVAGEVSQIRPYQTRNGKAMGFVTLEDLQGQIELVIFSRVWKDVVRWLEQDAIVVAEGKVDRERGSPKILVDKISEDFSAFEQNGNKKPGMAKINSARIQEPQIQPIVQPITDPIQPPDEQFDPAINDEKPPLPMEDAWEETSSKSTNPIEIKVQTLDATDQKKTTPAVAQFQETTEATATVPSNWTGESIDSEPKIVTVMLDSSGDRNRDALRMRRVHGLLNSYPGNDRFAFLLFESSHRYLLEFPSSSTGYCAELHAQLVELVGEHRIRIETLRYQ
jgi:DNA polymerase-3 subunit alpha